MAITIDASSPVPAACTGTGLQTLATTAAFDPPANTWIYASRTAIRGAAGGGTVSFVVPTNTGTALTWTLVGSQISAASGGVAVYRAFNATAQVGITVASRATYSATIGSATNGDYLWVDVWNGTNATQTTAAFLTGTSITTTTTTSVTTTATGSQVVALIFDYSSGNTAVNYTSSDTINSQNNGSIIFASARAYKVSNSGAAGAVSVNFVTTDVNRSQTYIVYEILAGAQVALIANILLGLTGCG